MVERRIAVAEKVESAEAGQDAVKRADQNRQLYRYQVPPGLAKTTGVHEVALVELTSGEEIMAAGRAQGSPLRLAFELAKESVRQINGNENINTGDGSSDAFWGRRVPGMSKLRQMVLSAYGEIHNPEVDAVQSFLKSRQVTVG